MKSFAFVVNLTSIKQIKDTWPMLRIVPDFLISSFLNKLQPFKVWRIPKIQSIQGNIIAGYIIACPLLRQEENYFLDKIIAAAGIAEQLGARIIGLDSFFSAVTDKRHNTIIRNLKIPLTNGSVLSAWATVEGVYRIAKTKGINLKNSTLVIIGATDSVGSLCARKLADYFTRIIIVAKERDKLEQLKEKILLLNPIEVIIEEEAHRGIKDADIVIDADGSSELAFDREDLKDNAIVCELSTSSLIFDKPISRQDITIIRPGLIKLPYPLKLGINTGLPKGIINSSLAETMLLTFREGFMSHSFGDDINLDKLEELADLSVQHGFEVWIPEAPMI